MSSSPSASPSSYLTPTLSLPPPSPDMSSILGVLSDLRKFLIHAITSDPDTENVQREVQTLHKSLIIIFRILSNKAIEDKEQTLINLVKDNTCEYGYSDLQNLRLIVTRTLIELHMIKKQAYLSAKNDPYAHRSEVTV